MMEREAEVPAGILSVRVSLRDRREVLQKEELAGLSHEPVGLKRPKEGQGVEEERVRMGSVSAVKETHVERFVFNYYYYFHSRLVYN